MDLLAGIGAWPGAAWLRGASTAYLFVNATHILGIALLLGAILPLDVRLMGLFGSVPLTAIGPFLSRVAAFGLVLAVVTGAWLFSVRPVEYAANAAFLWKIGLLALALANVGLVHATGAFQRAMAGGPVSRGLRVSAALSLVMWLAVLLAGRWIGFL